MGKASYSEKHTIVTCSTKISVKKDIKKLLHNRFLDRYSFNLNANFFRETMSSRLEKELSYEHSVTQLVHVKSHFHFFDSIFTVC